MTVMEMSLPSGFTADKESIVSIEKTANVKRVETKNSDTTFVVYFEEVNITEVCPTFDGYSTYDVANQKPAPVVVYDYYQLCNYIYIYAD